MASMQRFRQTYLGYLHILFITKNISVRISTSVSFSLQLPFKSVLKSHIKDLWMNLTMASMQHEHSVLEQHILIKHFIY